MKITALLKEHLQKNFGLAANATDDAVRLLTGEKLASGELSPAQYQEFTKSDAAGSVKSLIDAAVKEQLAPIASGLDALTKHLGLGGAGGQTQLGGDGASLLPAGQPAGEKSGASNTEAGTQDALPFSEDFAQATKALSDSRGPSAVPVETSTEPGVSKAHQIMAGGAGTAGGGARIKSVAERYSHTTKNVTYDESKNDYLKKTFGGHQVMSAGDGEGVHGLEHPSQFQKAVCGAWFKYASLSAARKSGVGLRMKWTEQDQQLVDYALHEMPFTGVAGHVAADQDGRFGFTNRKLYEWERKALLDDALSGGLEAVPIAFDDAVIITPLLSGELFPLVNLVTVTRGRRIEAFSIGNPTFTWGAGDGTNIPLFNTDSFIAAFDNTIHEAVGAMTVGLDFNEDSPVAVGEIITGRYGEAAKKTLDDMVAVGDGVSQPTGVFVGSGTASVNSTNGGSGPPTLADYSATQFGLQKEFRNARSVYISNDITYARSRNLKVDPQTSSTDERRLMGMNFQSYESLGFAHKINRSIANTKLGFFDLGRFRMYRRAGFAIRIERAGQALALANEQLIVCRMRFGGALETGSAGAVMADCQS